MTLDLNSYLEYDVRAYFEQYTDFDNKSVLDFGCNRSNFIRYKPHNNYTGIDIIKEVIETNSKLLKRPKFDDEKIVGIIIKIEKGLAIPPVK